jgi:hypothetical protein
LGAVADEPPVCRHRRRETHRSLLSRKVVGMGKKTDLTKLLAVSRAGTTGPVKVMVRSAILTLVNTPVSTPNLDRTTLRLSRHAEDSAWGVCLFPAVHL